MYIVMFLLMHWKATLAAAGVAVALGTAVVVYNNIKDSGRQEERRQIERETNDATSRANSAEHAVRLCYSSGGMWDHAAKRCARP